MDTWHTTSAIL